jgi:hypothetical protein
MKYENPVTVLMVAEKPSIALSIAEAISGKVFKKQQNFEFEGKFRGA